MANYNPFSVSTLLDALQELRLSAASENMNEEPPVIPPRGGDSLFFSEFYTTFTSQELDMCLLRTFDLMTNSREDVAQYFTDMISEFDTSELQRMAFFLTSDSDYFMEIARNKYGSKRMQQLLGKSDDVDTFFAEAINRLFIEVMTDKHASYVAIQGMRVFDRDKKELIYYKILIHALDLARDQHGCTALNEIITDLDDPYDRNPILEIVAHNALVLSNHVYGNFVVQHVLKLKNLRYTHHSIAANLRGQFVDLSFEKYGSYVVERLLEADESVMEEVILEMIMECEKDKLMRLARSEYGNVVVSKALGNTNEILTADLYMGLVRKLMPSRDLLRSSHGSNIAAILDSIHSRCSRLSPQTCF